MSTIPRRPEPSPATSIGREPRARKASFDYGYRDVHRKGSDGRMKVTRIPLTLEDVLHPRFGDVHLVSDPHTEDCTYLRTVAKGRYAADPAVVVLSDCGIFWDVPRLKHHSPDLAVIFGVKHRKGWETFHVRKEGVRPSLIIEVTSPKTRVNDVVTKVKQYAEAGVPHYVIADQSNEGGRRKLELISHRLDAGVYQKVALPDASRAWLQPLGLWLAVTVNPETGGDRLALIDPATGSEIGDYTAISRAYLVEQEARAAAEARAAEEHQARAAAEARAAGAEARAAESEARARAAEERLRRLEGRTDGQA